MYIFCIIMIAIASILLILAVLVQSPKSGMAANFGAANQTMGVRQTTDFLEKFTWAMIAAIVFFSLLAATAAPAIEEAEDSSNLIEQTVAAAQESLNAEANTAEATLAGETDITVGAEDTTATIELNDANAVVEQGVETAEPIVAEGVETAEAIVAESVEAAEAIAAESVEAAEAAMAQSMDAAMGGM